MNTTFLITILLAFVLFNTKAQIVDIPDPILKHNLVNLNVVDTNNSGTGDADADTNDDGEIQVSEAEAVIGLYLIQTGILSMEGIESFINLVNFQCQDNLFPSLDVSNMSNLKYLLTQGNGQLVSIDVTQNSQLEYLNCSANSLSSIDVSENSVLKTLVIQGNNLTDIGVTNNVNLEHLSIGGQNIAVLDISQNSNLEYLNIGNCNFTSIDLSYNTNLLQLYCQENQITNLDLSLNPNLDLLNCNDNLITNLDVSNNLLLRFLSCERVPLASLDLSVNTEIRNIYLRETQLTSVNLQNGNNENILYFVAYDNLNLTCIQVDNLEYSNAQDCNAPIYWCKDETAIYSEDCSLGLNDILETQLSIYPNPAKDVLMLYNESESIIESVKLYDALGKLVIEQSNPSNQLDISNISSGLLFVKIETDEGVVTKKVIKD